MNLDDIPFLDHHAHPLSRAGATRDAAGFRQWFSESTDAQIHERHVPNTIFFRTAVRWLAEELDCAPALEEVMRARAARSYESWTRALFEQANIELLLCDYGYSGDQALNHEEMKALLPCEVRPILRLETLAEELIRGHARFEDMVDAFVQQVGAARAAGYTALKSIVAYRSGLAVAPVPKEEAKRAFESEKKASAEMEAFRLASKPLCDYLLLLAVNEAEKQALPVQLHTGFGDEDADLLWANPLHLRSLIEGTRAPLVLLHAGWPYFRETAHLAAIYPHVWLDLSLAVPFATAGIPAMIRDILGMAPISKVMLATDAFTMPEIYWLAARWGRWGLGKVLDELVADSLLTAVEADQAARRIMHGNARALYV